MFSPEGFVPFAQSKGWMLAHAEDFYLECALPWATKQASKGVEADDADPFRTAQAGRLLFLEWLINTCLIIQPGAVYLTSPSGSVMRAADVFFAADDHLSWYDFEWPLSDDELRPIAEGGQADEILNTRFSYYFWDMLSCCIEAPSADDCSKLAPEALALLEKIKPFDGWSVCFKHEDCETIEQFLTNIFDWTGKQVNAIPKGRPRKQEVAAKLYRSLYPDGHDAKGLTWQQAAHAVGQVGKMTVSIDTLRRGLAKF
ncbi:hypothetical protein ACROSR_15775 [Roseovarius tibetensis]|uniref:hypothetical protein n=1 Tax=Roseovarius tibetensis TaxID=2685897 RepID=UPI003D7F335C